jgi:hypothetical protein
MFFSNKVQNPRHITTSLQLGMLQKSKAVIQAFNDDIVNM